MPATDAPATSTTIVDQRIGDLSLPIVGVYDVKDGVLASGVDPSYAKVWGRFNQLVDATQFPAITLFVALDVKSSAEGIAGAVASIENDPTHYYVALDVSGGVSGKSLDGAMIHEFAHYLTLNPDQISLDTSGAASCPISTFNGRCPQPGSYLGDFEAAFWAGYTDDKADATQAAQDTRFATGDFVSQYSTINPDEDIAETFLFWVREDAAPTGDSVLDQKLRFFDAYPELVKIKEHILASL
ncbi:MAG: hypothetical protein JWM34_4428 [Ilumatobacteraceae bacterium]|nr:hypothetical protein [Ilumatobacteraceae bacterium]